MTPTEARQQFHLACERASNLSDRVRRAERSLAVNTARNRRQPHLAWERIIESQRLALVSLRAELAEATAAVELAREHLPLTDIAA